MDQSRLTHVPVPVPDRRQTQPPKQFDELKQALLWHEPMAQAAWGGARATAAPPSAEATALRFVEVNRRN